VCLQDFPYRGKSLQEGVRACACESAFWAHDVQDPAIYTSFSFDCRFPMSCALPLMKVATKMKRKLRDAFLKSSLFLSAAGVIYAP
jgi:hypothetical protein